MDKQAVLVVEDENALQLILRDILEEAGFAVTVSATGEQALEHVERKRPAYVALVTDINLAGSDLTGWDVAHKARELDGSLAVVYMTGAAAADWPSHGVPNSILVTKPFAPAQIVTAVSQLLNLGSGTGS